MKQIIITILVLISGLNINASNAENLWDKPSQELIGTTKDIVVYRSPSCGCCSKWLEHLKKHDFNVIDNVTEDVQSIKDRSGITAASASCHTAIVNGYIIEGHVPAADIKALLMAKINIRGLSVPGMVTGTPGMEMGAQKSPFKVIAFDKNGQLKVFKTYDKY